MKHKQQGSIHLILIGIAALLIVSALTYTFLNTFAHKPNSVQGDKYTYQPEVNDSKSPRTYTEFKDWNVRFPSDVNYDLKRNSASGSNTAYYIGFQALASTCASPNTPWLGIIQRFDNPDEKQTVGPDAGKTMNEIFGSKGKIIDGNLYYYDTATQFCTRNTSNPEIEQAAKKLESEIASLEAY